jgi:hypothetical protein
MEMSLNSVVFFAPFIASVAALTALIISIVIHLRIKRIFKSTNMPDIEKLIGLHTKTLEDFVNFKAESISYMKFLDNRIKKKTANASILRYNSFQGSGGNQSFSSVFANEEGDGVVITSLHTRERTNVFAKPLTKWQSENNLLEEETQTITMAKQNEPKQ